MNIRSNALITQAVGLLEQVQGTEQEISQIRDCIRQLNAIALLSIIKQSNEL